MNEQNPTAAEPVANFQAYGNAGTMYADGRSSLTPQEQGPAQAFMQDLQSMEKDRDVQRMAERFSPSCQLWRQTFHQPHEGAEGVQKFWQEYLQPFESIETRFTNVMERDGLAVLEWESQGALQGGRPIHYRGVSILEFEAGARVKTFKTYFDSAHFITAQAATQH